MSSLAFVGFAFGTRNIEVARKTWFGLIESQPMASLFLPEEVLLRCTGMSREGLRTGSNAMYRAIRDMDYYCEVKSELESLYEEFQGVIGDRSAQFINQFFHNVEGGIWHLCLLRYLSRRGFDLITPPDEGAPDIKALKDQRTHWIEAKCSHLAEGDRNPEYTDGVSVEWRDDNDPGVLLRLSNSIGEGQKQFKKWCEEKVVLKGDGKIIAVAAHSIERARRGDFMRKVLTSGVEVKKPNGAVVVLDCFRRERSEDCVDAVIYTPYDPLTYLKNQETAIQWINRE